MCTVAARLHPNASASTAYLRGRRLASARAGIVTAFAWGLLEAIVWPIVPDFFVAPLAAAAPRRWWRLAVGAAAGSVCGGAISYLLGGTEVGRSLLAHAPLITDAMRARAAAWTSGAGALGLLHQPLSGVPYKTFALQASPVAPFGAFVAVSLVVRAVRLIAVAGLFALVGRVMRRSLERAYGTLVIVYCVWFAAGLWATVASWR
jgi:1-acyl-sn-glycerol-3-phosphate acyltransferase